jgi:molybdopterin synthase sulfur carrier subunit
MASIAFTPHLRHVGPTDRTRYEGATLSQVLDAVGADFPRLRGYLLDDHGKLRKHVAVFVDGVMRPRDRALDVPLTDSSDVYVFQALSGG